MDRATHGLLQSRVTIGLARLILLSVLSLPALPASAAEPRFVVVSQSIPPLTIPPLQSPSSHIGEASQPLSDENITSQQPTTSEQRGTEVMTSADYALIVSIPSIFISIGALLWNVWQKFIFVKPALQVTFSKGTVVLPGVPTTTNHRLLHLSVTNMGPGPVILTACAAKSRKHWWKRAKFYGMIVPIHGDPADPNLVGIGPFGGGLPAKIDAGEVKSFYFPYTKDCFLNEDLARIGINDTYQRIIWCRRSDMRKVYRSYQQDFRGKLHTPPSTNAAFGGH